MSALPSAPESRSASQEKLVVLLLPSAVGSAADLTGLRATLIDPAVPVRVLLCLVDDSADRLVAILDQIGVATEILLGPQVTAPSTRAFTARALPGTSLKDQTELALALSDVVLVASKSDQTAFNRTVEELGKPMLVPGERLPHLSTLPVSHDLDPDMPGFRRACGRAICGRFEQLLLELFAFNWSEENGVGKSWRKIRKSLSWKWRPGSYFAPSNWTTLVPDPTVLEAPEMLACFNLLDRSALYGSYIHRDLVWLEHIGAAFAVFFAVAGSLDLWGGFFDRVGQAIFGESAARLLKDHHGLVWGLLELITLVGVAVMVFKARRSELQDRWTAYRLGAEQLRIAIMSMPLLVLPSAFATEDKPPAPDDVHRGLWSRLLSWIRAHMLPRPNPASTPGQAAAPTDTDRQAHKDAQHGFIVLSQVKRLMRNRGLPRVEGALTPVRAAAWLRLIVEDQLTYHRDNHGKLEQAERGLRGLTQLIFAVAVAAVLAHFYWPQAHELLLATAAAPAFAAALHGTGTRLGIVHRAALSGDVRRELVTIRNDLGKIENMPASQEAWQEVRRLAFAAAEAMGRENSSWHGLVRRYRDDLP